jgi:glutamyl/glutaminyl-tRNA synthetase
MGVTHVFRADEFISSTPRFLSLYEALEITPPAFVTLPPILREDRTKKLGKRDGAKDILDYRAEGYTSDAMANFLALTGWNPGTEQEVFSRDELLATFDISRIQHHGAVLNAEKLRWLNREHLARLDDASFADYALPVLTRELRARGLTVDDTAAHTVLPIIRDRISTYEDVVTMTQAGDLDFFVKAPVLDRELISGKGSIASKAAEHLQTVHTMLDRVGETEFTAGHLKEIIWSYATERGRGEVLWPLRYALTGRNKSPDPFEVAGAIGKPQTLIRIDAAILTLTARHV